MCQPHFRRGREWSNLSWAFCLLSLALSCLLPLVSLLSTSRASCGDLQRLPNPIVPILSVPFSPLSGPVAGSVGNVRVPVSFSQRTDELRIQIHPKQFRSCLGQNCLLGGPGGCAPKCRRVHVCAFPAPDVNNPSLVLFRFPDFFRCGPH